MSDEEREPMPLEPAETPGPTDTPPEEAVEAPPPAEAEAPSMPDADETTLSIPPVAPEPPEAPIPPEAPVPPVVAPPPAAPEVIADTAEVTGDDKLLAALTWFTMVIFQLPILSVILLLIEPNRNRSFQRYHAVTSTAFWFVAVLYEIVLGLAATMLTVVTLGIGVVCLICLCPIIFLPHIVALVYAFYALTGRTPEIPVVSRVAREQKWI